MKQYTHRFSLIPLKSIKSKWHQSIVLEENATVFTFMSDNPVRLEQEQQSGESGNHYENTFEAVVKDDTVTRFNGQRAVIAVTLSDGSVRYHGDPDSAPIINITPYPGRFAVRATFKSTEFVSL